MKLLFYLPLLSLMLAFSCHKPSTTSSKCNYVGNWKIERITGGLGGVIHGLREHRLTICDDMTYIVDSAQNNYIKKPYTVITVTDIETNQQAQAILFGAPNYDFPGLFSARPYIIDCDNLGNLILKENCIDCYTFYYVKYY